MSSASQTSSASSILVTGGGTGIGFAIAEAFVGLGYGVSIVGRRRSVLEEAAHRLTRTAGAGAVQAIDQDISAEAGPDSAVAAHMERFGAMNALVCAAGVYEQVGFLDMTPDVWDRAFDTNIRGNMLVALAAARIMAKAGGGRIVFIGSVLSHHSEPQTAAYSASKAAMMSLARSMAVDLAPSGIRVNSVAPGWTETAMSEADTAGAPPEAMGRVNPLSRTGRPGEIAEVVRYLVCDAPDFLTGQTIYVDGGQTIRAPTI